MRDQSIVYISRWCMLMLGVLMGCFPFSNTKQVDAMSSTDSVHVWIDSALGSYSDLFSGHTALSFYKSHDFRPVWLANKKYPFLADSMRLLIRSADMYGLQRQDYHWNEIEILSDTARGLNESVHLRRLDLLLTNAFFTMASHLKNGRFVKNTAERICGPSQPDTVQMMLLNEVLKGKGLRHVLESQEPSYVMYGLLRNALRETLDSAGRDLQASGIVYDSLSALKIATLEVNLERWRWESALKDRYIAVNIPAYHMEVVEGGKSVLASRVIVGTPKTPTPVLDGLMKTFVVYPYWHVPRHISTDEILPHLQQDTAYLEAHRYEVLDIDGNILDPSTMDWLQYGTNNFPFMLRQREGPANSLGIIKFVFNNDYGVYLHDTNARRLFKKEKRALSHGCVRVEKALDLAHYLVRNDNIYCSPEDLDQYLEVKQRVEIRLPEYMPVHIRYFTCEYRDGALQFYQDIYNLDKALMKINDIMIE